MRYSIVYPSGKRCFQRGVFEVVQQGDFILPTIWICEAGADYRKNTDIPALILDPRGVITDTATREVVYSPRDYQMVFGGLSPMVWVYDWLEENPKWGVRRSG